MYLPYGQCMANFLEVYVIIDQYIADFPIRYLYRQDEHLGYHCECAPDYSGRYCQIHFPFDIDECNPNPCQNEASCIVSQKTMANTIQICVCVCVCVCVCECVCVCVCVSKIYA